MGYWAGRRERSGWPRSTPRTETISNGKEEETMIHFIGAGPGAADLITVRGARLLREADVIIYAGSLVNPALLENK